jgi:hypothetical protein
VFGNGKPNVPTEKWNGETGATVLLNLEGGLGDQIHGARFARDIARLGNKVIVACSGSLAQIISQIEGVTTVVQHEAVFGVVHDFWVPSHVCGIPLQLQYADVDGAAYIPSLTLRKARSYVLALDGRVTLSSSTSSTGSLTLSCYLMRLRVPMPNSLAYSETRGPSTNPSGLRTYV